ncbi:MAG: hypothetical protein M3Y77_11755 [Actinomycetota bacterium]|nr:hypothetical protein [Actinomycetota bacterium]
MTTSATGLGGFFGAVEVGGFGRPVAAPEDDRAVLVGADERLDPLLLAAEGLAAGLLAAESLKEASGTRLDDDAADDVGALVPTVRVAVPPESGLVQAVSNSAAASPTTPPMRRRRRRRVRSSATDLLRMGVAPDWW